MCAMMSCWEAEGGGGVRVCHIEMLMSPHSGGDSWRGTEHGVMSLPIWTTEESDGGRGGGVWGGHSGRSMAPGFVCSYAYVHSSLVCVCVPLH